MKWFSRGTALLMMIALGFTSCQKELSIDTSAGGGGTNNGGGGNGGGSTAGYYIRGKMDGVAFNFTSTPMVMLNDFGVGVTTMSLIAGKGGNSLEGLNLSINFSNGLKPAVGTYSETDNTLDYVVAGVYNPNSMSFVYGTGLTLPGPKPLVIKILTKSATEMTGTFEGDFFKNDLTAGTVSSTEKKTFTEGEFKLKIP